MRTRLFAAVLLVCAYSLPAMAQSVGEIAGEVHDTTGAAIAEVSVTATNTETNVARATRTNSSGAYDFPGLNPGNYSVKAEKQGFKTVPIWLPCCLQLSMHILARIYHVLCPRFSKTIKARCLHPL